MYARSPTSSPSLSQRPCIPAPADHAYLAEAVAPFCFSGSVPKVVRQRSHHLVFAQLLVHAERAEVVCVIAHSSVFPIDEVGMSVFVDEEFRPKKSVYTSTLMRRIVPLGICPNGTILYLIRRQLFGIDSLPMTVGMGGKSLEIQTPEDK